MRDQQVIGRWIYHTISLTMLLLWGVALMSPEPWQTVWLLTAATQLGLLFVFARDYAPVSALARGLLRLPASPLLPAWRWHETVGEVLVVGSGILLAASHLFTLYEGPWHGLVWLTAPAGVLVWTLLARYLLRAGRPSQR